MKIKYQWFVIVLIGLLFSVIGIDPAYADRSFVSDASLPSPLAAGTCGTLVVDSGVADAGKSINGFLNDQYVWYDSACRLRSVALARNDTSKGGNAKQFTYTLSGGTTRTINPGSGGAAGFGYVVAHLSNPSFARSYGADDSPLGSGNSAAYNKLFSGENHAVHEYTLNYVRYGLTQSAITNHSIDPWTWINNAADPNRQYVTVYNVPVRIQWMFATGRDYPIWSVTFDLSAAPDHAIDSDFRAPYGDMNIEGGGGTDIVSGVAWGDTYKFVTSGSPFTMDNDWDYSQLNSGAPYASLWTSIVDAEMGLAGTQITALQNAGGYNNYLAPVWRGKTSANIGQLCMSDGGAGLPYDHKLPCTSDWAYQLIQYSVANANETTNNKRLAWGADWGSLGNSSFFSSNGYTVSGYPKVSYSVYVVLDPHSKNPTQTMAAQAETVSLTTLTASVGTVRTSGSAGVGRADTKTYNPVGFSPIFGTWEVNALNNNINLSFTISNQATSTLDTPIIVIHNYTASASSAQILLDGAALTANSDYFISERPAASELWVTLNKKISGTHTFQVITDVTAPAVLSSLRASATPTNLSSVDFTVTFNKFVTGVDTTDFSLTTSGVSGATVSGVSGSGNAYMVTVNTGTGSGTIRLDLVNDNSIKDTALNPLTAGFTSGEVYTVSKAVTSATFADVPLTYWASSYIERLYNAGVTGGCLTVPLNYCPENTVTRAQMAIFLLKGIHGSSYVPPTVGSSTGFSDVPVGAFADAWIKQLAAEGITGGCGTGIYCPDNTVTRAQMAIFLLKAKYGTSFSPPAATGVFTDVPVGAFADKWIEKLATEGITGGCGTGIYCPDASVTRAQMAVFLVKAFGLP